MKVLLTNGSRHTGGLYGIRSHGGTYQEAVKYATYSKDSKQ